MYRVFIQIIHPHTHIHISHTTAHSYLLSLQGKQSTDCGKNSRTILPSVSRCCVWWFSQKCVYGHCIVCRHMLANWIVTIVLATCTSTTCMPSMEVVVGNLYVNLLVQMHTDAHRLKHTSHFSVCRTGLQDHTKSFWKSFSNIQLPFSKMQAETLCVAL